MTVNKFDFDRLKENMYHLLLRGLDGRGRF